MVRLPQPDPDEDAIAQINVSRVGFQLVNENAGVQRDPAMTPQERLQTRQSKLFRSLRR